mgnify:CR=1 FL=1
MPPRLTKVALKALDVKIDDIFDTLLANLTGVFQGGKRLWLRIVTEQTIPGLYTDAAAAEGGWPSRENLDRLVGICTDLIDKHRADAKANVKQRLSAVLESAAQDHPDQPVAKVLEGALAEVWDKVTANVQRVVETETWRAQALGIREGIGHVAAALDIADPVIFFLCVKDNRLCEECRRLHLMPDGQQPRLWYSSELKSGYHKKGDSVPNWDGLHPSCRCQLTTLMPGYTFTSGGRVSYKEEKWNEIEKQRKG